MEFAAAGAAAGTVAAPRPGTAVGGAAGGAVGFIVGATIVIGAAAGIAYVATRDGEGAEGAAPSLPDASSDTVADEPLPRGGTYVLKDPVTGEIVRSGRTNDLERRRAEHARDPNLADTEFDVDARTDDYAQQRGREQYLHEKYQPKYNRIRGVDPKNPNRVRYERPGKGVKGKY